jgi:polar amino acid transport system permease protein
MVGVIFLILSIPAAIGIRKLEKSVNKAQGKVKN